MEMDEKFQGIRMAGVGVLLMGSAALVAWLWEGLLVVIEGLLGFVVGTAFMIGVFMVGAWAVTFVLGAIGGVIGARWRDE